MKMQKEAVQFYGALAFTGLVCLAAVTFTVYYLTGAVSPMALRWWAVLATLALPVTMAVTWKLAHTAAAEHLSGFDRGLTGAEQTLTTVGRGLSAVASLARTAAAQQRTAAPSWQMAADDLLPPPVHILPVKNNVEQIDL